MVEIVSKAELPWRSKRSYYQLAYQRALARLRDLHRPVFERLRDEEPDMSYQQVSYLLRDRYRRDFELLRDEEIDRMADQPERDRT